LSFVNFADFFSEGAFFALLQVLLIDIVLAGDNAVVIGMAASQVNKFDRKVVIFWGLVAAVVLRIVLAIFAVHLLRFVPLVIAGGILLLWVTWRLWRDIRHANKEHCANKLLAGDHPSDGTPHVKDRSKAHGVAVRRAIISIAAADVSMSLDNVLAVAGAARDHLEVLVIGLMMSIALMGLAATLIAKLLHKYPWVSYAGVFIVLFVALRMIWDGFVRLNHEGGIQGAMHTLGIV